MFMIDILFILEYYFDELPLFGGALAKFSEGRSLLAARIRVSGSLDLTPGSSELLLPASGSYWRLLVAPGNS